MRDRFPLLMVAALLFGALVTGALVRNSQRGDFADALSTWRSRETGARALYLLAEERGLPVKRRTRPLEKLEPGTSLAILAVPPSRDEGLTLEVIRESLADAGDGSDASEASVDAGADGDDAGAGSTDGGHASTDAGASNVAVDAHDAGDAAAGAGITPSVAATDGGDPGTASSTGPATRPRSLTGERASAGPRSDADAAPVAHGSTAERAAEPDASDLTAENEGSDTSDVSEASDLTGEDAVDLAGADDLDADDANESCSVPCDDSDEGVLDESPKHPERDALLKFLASGGRLFLATADALQDPLLESLGVSLASSDPELGSRTLVPAQVTPWTRGLQQVEAPIVGTLVLPPYAVPLLVDFKTGLPVAAWIPSENRGDGLLVFTAPVALDNAHLAAADNARFALAVLEWLAEDGRTVEFDEYSHGFRNERSLVDFAKRYGVHFALLQLLLGLLFWVLSMRRFGPPQPPEEEVRTGRSDLLAATANLYRGGRHHRGSAEQLARWLTQHCAAAAGLRPHATREEVLEALRVRGLTTTASALSEVWELAHHAASEAEVLATARATTAAVRELKNRQRGAGSDAARKEDAA